MASPADTPNYQKHQQQEEHGEADLPEVLILRPFPASFTLIGEHQFASSKFRLLKYDPRQDLVPFLSTHAKSIRAMVASASVPVDACLLDLLPSLGIIVTTSAGLNLIDLAECCHRGVRIANAGEVFSTDVADLAVGLLIDVWRKVSASRRYVNQGMWAIRGEYPLGSKQEDEKEHVPEVLLLKPLPFFTFLGENRFTSTKFRYLKPYDSNPPISDLGHFLSTRPQAVRAILISAGEPVDARLLNLLPSLGVVVTTSAGLNQVDLGECLRRGIKIANTRDIYSADVADLAVGLLIDAFRKVTASHRYVCEGLWVTRGDYPIASKLGGKRVGIVGLGSIGYEVAKRLEAFRCHVSYNSRKKKHLVSYPFYENVRQLASNCDALVICCSLTEQTHHMINKEVLLSLGKEGVIVNIGRGAIIDEKELVRCLVQGEIAGAGLDVFENEPNVPQELFALDNVVLSPHRAVFTPESLTDLSKLVVGNLEAFFANKPLLSEYTCD